jgi:hypothetical protein
MAANEASVLISGMQQRVASSSEQIILAVLQDFKDVSLE